MCVWQQYSPLASLVDVLHYIYKHTLSGQYANTG